MIVSKKILTIIKSSSRRVGTSCKIWIKTPYDNDFNLNVLQVMFYLYIPLDTNCFGEMYTHSDCDAFNIFPKSWSSATKLACLQLRPVSYQKCMLQYEEHNMTVEATWQQRKRIPLSILQQIVLSIPRCFLSLVRKNVGVKEL